MANTKPTRDERLLLMALCFISAITFTLAGWKGYHIWDDARYERETSGSDPIRWPCERDAEKLCTALSPGDSRMSHCLRDHDKEVSPNCLAYLEIYDPSDHWQNVCGQELQTVCAGRRQVVQCLKENLTILSPRCLALVREYRAKTEWRDACREDGEHLCQGIVPETSDMDQCLTSHQADLSISCRIYYQNRVKKE